MTLVVSYNFRQTSQFCFSLNCVLRFPAQLDVPAVAQGSQQWIWGPAWLYNSLVPMLGCTEIQAHVNSEVLVSEVTILNAAFQLWQSQSCTTGILCHIKPGSWEAKIV